MNLNISVTSSNMVQHLSNMVQYLSNMVQHLSNMVQHLSNISKDFWIFKLAQTDFSLIISYLTGVCTNWFFTDYGLFEVWTIQTDTNRYKLEKTDFSLIIGYLTDTNGYKPVKTGTTRYELIFLWLSAIYNDYKLF